MDPSWATPDPDSLRVHEQPGTLLNGEWIDWQEPEVTMSPTVMQRFASPANRSRTYVFGGFNIKGTPPMPRKRVKADVKTIKRTTDLAVMNEYRWDYYWDLLKRIVDTDDAREWGTYPGLAKGLAMPVFGGQPCIWKRRYFRRVKSLRRLLHKGEAKVSESRQLRGVAVEDTAVFLALWEATAHFVVKGDSHSDTRLRKGMMRTDLRNFRKFIIEMMEKDVGTQHEPAPILFQGDLNIHKGTWAYRALMAIVRELGGRIIGHHGIEYTIIFDSHSRTKVRVEAIRYVWPLPKGPLYTDHEGRLTKFHLWRP